MQLRKWYFSTNASGFANNKELMAVAVTSCRENTDLKPICLYNGTVKAHVDFLRGLEVEVVPHGCSLEADLRPAYGDKYDQFSGHWLRVDLPEIEPEDDFVLYTDVDVMFEGPPLVPVVPPLLAAGPEGRPDDLERPRPGVGALDALLGGRGLRRLRGKGPRWAPWNRRRAHFSSGVLVMNLPGLRGVHQEFLAAIRARLRGDFRYPTHDQASFNDFFERSFTPLGAEMNWKPYWGRNDDARIVHFHGPKPRHVRAVASGTGRGLSTEYRTLFDRSPEGYAFYAGRFDRYLAQARSRGATNARRAVTERAAAPATSGGPAGPSPGSLSGA